jgi:hypothetical protein
MPPAASKRQNIVAYLLDTLLPTITAGATYNYTLKTISRGLKNPEKMAAHEFPAVFLAASHEKRQNLTKNQYHANPMQVVLVGYVRNTAATPGKANNEVQKDLDKLISDITKALETDPLLGGAAGLVKNSEITDVVTDEGTDKIPVAACVITVEYQYVVEGTTT